MRKLLAEWVAVLTGLLVCFLAVLFALIQNPGTLSTHPLKSTVQESQEPDRETRSKAAKENLDMELGKVIYTALRCRTCHSIRGEGNRRNPLDGVGKRLTAEEIRQWIIAPGEIAPEVRKHDYSYLSPVQVDLLVKYLMSLE